ncbi:hypothetical protein CXB51_003350 [Gossypium anomalum]|uniref:Uncharacterized protein n=1 Tax=Gossypium anomalum TaxID=47600 RepID=A0A8J5ZFS2_9ROSI|nr:hypothetical protein CXB51_003350 [Gossypium anomalum]
MLWGNIGDNSSGFLGDLDGFIQQLVNFLCSLWMLLVIICMDLKKFNLHKNSFFFFFFLLLGFASFVLFFFFLVFLIYHTEDVFRVGGFRYSFNLIFMHLFVCLYRIISLL